MNIFSIILEENLYCQFKLIATYQHIMIANLRSATNTHLQPPVNQ